VITFVLGGQEVDGFRWIWQRWCPSNLALVFRREGCASDLICSGDFITLKYELLDNGRFDFLYDKVQLYDTLRLLINQKQASPMF